MKKMVLVLMLVLPLLAPLGAFAQTEPAPAAATSAAPTGDAPAPVAEPAPVATPAPAGDPLTQIDALVEKALKAYNDQDPKAFYADFAKAMAAIATDQAFATLYTNMYLAQHGKYVSRQLIKEKSVITDDSPVGLVVYKAVFEKNDKIQISVNVMKEENTWRLMQVQFGPEQ